jgi:hypothetical protein
MTIKATLLSFFHSSLSCLQLTTSNYLTSSLRHLLKYITINGHRCQFLVVFICVCVWRMHTNISLDSIWSRKISRLRLCLYTSSTQIKTKCNLSILCILEF